MMLGSWKEKKRKGKIQGQRVAEITHINTGMEG
jgi:hypothetical protein